MPETKVPSLALPANIKDPQLRRVLESYKEALDIRLGRRGDKLDRAVTLRELVAAGMARVTGSGGFVGEQLDLDLDDLIYDGSADLGTQPTAPTGFVVEGAYSTVILKWDAPYDAYKNHSHTEIWRAPSDDLGSALLVGVSSDFMFSDPIGIGGTFYYWIRFVSLAGIAGPFNGTAGTMAQTAIPADQIKQELLNSLGYEHFNVADGAFPIKLVDTLPPLPDSRYPAGAHVSLTPNAILYKTDNGSSWRKVVNAGEMDGQITGVQISNNAISAPKIAANAITANAISANAVTAGKILAGAVLADKIAAGAIVANKIATNAVTSAKIVAGAVSADKISVSSLSAVSSNLGTIMVGSANIHDAAITTLKIQGEAVTVPLSAAQSGGGAVTYGTAAQVNSNTVSVFSIKSSLSFTNNSTVPLSLMVLGFGRYGTVTGESNGFAAWGACITSQIGSGAHTPIVGTGVMKGDIVALSARVVLSAGANIMLALRVAGVTGQGTGTFGNGGLVVLGTRR